MARVGSSYGNLKRVVVCPPPPPLDLMAPFTSGHMTTNSMPSSRQPRPSQKPVAYAWAECAAYGSRIGEIENLQRNLQCQEE